MSRWLREVWGTHSEIPDDFWNRTDRQNATMLTVVEHTWSDDSVRSVTDLRIDIDLHGKLHGTFTDLHGCEQ